MTQKDTEWEKVRATAERSEHEQIPSLLSPFQACQGQQGGESARGWKAVKSTHASQDVDETIKTNMTKTTVRAGERSESGKEIGEKEGKGDRVKGKTVDLSDGLMGTKASDKNKGEMPRTQKSTEQGQTGGRGDHTWTVRPAMKTARVRGNRSQQKKPKRPARPTRQRPQYVQANAARAGRRLEKRRERGIG